MTTINYKNVDLRVMQQSNEIKEEGTHTMRGALSVNTDEGVATFVEDKARRTSKNPVFWEGNLLKMRLNKDGKLRTTFCLDVPADFDKCAKLAECLTNDFCGVLGVLVELSEAKRGEKRKERNQPPQPPRGSKKAERMSA